MGGEIYGSCQSDAGLKTYRFTRLPPGPATTEVAAPVYEGVQVPVTLRSGRNRRAPV